MKKPIYFALFLMTLAMISAFTSRAHADVNCSQSPSSVQLAVDYLSLVERGGFGLLGPIDESGRDVETICSQMKNYNIQPSSSRDGFINVVLNLDNESCTVSMKPMGNEKYDQVHLDSCEK
jgi:hypothetical protein